MTFTALHRELGASPGPLTDDLLARAVTTGVRETDDLDWKSELPPTKGITQTDYPKDVAAMANSGGGLIVYGVTESQKAATGRQDVGEFDEGYERTLRSAAITAISPPVFGLTIHRLGDDPSRAVIVKVPGGLDGPHLIYRGEYFGAPVRNDADTVWMKERQIEAMYRARFDERRHAREALASLYEEASAGRGTAARAWLVAVAHPRTPQLSSRLSRDDARQVLSKARSLALGFADRSAQHPLESVDSSNPRPGLRRWVAVNTETSERNMWKESWASIHHDGSVTLAAAVGGARLSADGFLKGEEVRASRIECAVADLMALVRTTGEAVGTTEYDIRIGIESETVPLTILTIDNFGQMFGGVSTPLHRYTPVEVTSRADTAPAAFHRQVFELAEDCVNQGGMSQLTAIRPPEEAP